MQKKKKKFHSISLLCNYVTLWCPKTFENIFDSPYIFVKMAIFEIYTVDFSQKWFKWWSSVRNCRKTNYCIDLPLLLGYFCRQVPTSYQMHPR